MMKNKFAVEGPEEGRPLGVVRGLKVKLRRGYRKRDYILSISNVENVETYSYLHLW